MRPEDISECKKAYDKYKEKYVITEHVPDAIFGPVIHRPPKPKDVTKIVNYGLPKKKRKFPFYTDDYVDRMTARDENGKYLYPEFLAQEVDRRMNGLFFFNGNTLEWVTGHHYMTLQYWKIPSPDPKTKRMRRERPMFIDAQRDWWYAMREVRRLEKALGMIYIGYRRSGKTVNAIAEGYWDATENEESVFPIQSKTEADAAKVFTKLIDSWKLLPAFLKPIDDGSTTQAKKLVFAHPKQRNVEISERINKDSLNSKIYYTPNTEVTVDGDYISYFFKDEIAKGEKNIDVNEQWEVVRFTLMVGSIIVGKAVLTSTVEDSEKYGSAHAKKLWDRSDWNKQENGQTESGLIQFFLPAYYGYIGDDEGKQFVDEWGYSNIKAAKEYHEKVCARLKGDALISRKRKIPLSINDAWINKNRENTFDTRKLIEQRIYVHKIGSMGVRGNFEWLHGLRDGKVIWRPDPNGKWVVYVMPKEEDQGKFEYVGNTRKPTRNYFWTGVDPFSHNTTVREGSMGAAITMMEHYPFEAGRDKVACIYHFRESTASQLADDVIKQMVFYSSMTLPERQNYGLTQTIVDRHYSGYLMKNVLEKDAKKRAKDDFGWPNNSPEQREALISLIQSYIVDYIGYNQMKDDYGEFYHDELLNQLLDFDVNKWGKYDLVVAFGLALAAMRGKPAQQVVEWSSKDWFGV